jgi:hypothetical protein
MKAAVRGVGIVVAVCFAALPALASFQASDLVYVPVAAHNDGVEGSVWRTDLHVTNVDEVAIDVAIFFFPSGLSNNSSYLSRSRGLAGRSDQGFGYVNEALADIPPGGTARLVDVVGEYWEPDIGGVAYLGGMVVFAYEAGTLDAEGGRVLRNALVQSRTYNETTILVPHPELADAYVEEPTSYGQTVHGVPWYDLADPSAVDDELGLDYTYQILTGGVQDEDHRYNLGIFNASDPQTTIRIEVKPLQADGTPFLNEDSNEISLNVTLPPLGHVQYNSILSRTLGIDEADVATFHVSFMSWSTTSPEPKPAFTCYGSVVGELSNDPTTVQPSFEAPYDVECVWSVFDEAAGELTGGWDQALCKQRVRQNKRARPLALPGL